MAKQGCKLRHSDSACLFLLRMSQASIHVSVEPQSSLLLLWPHLPHLINGHSSWCLLELKFSSSILASILPLRLLFLPPGLLNWWWTHFSSSHSYVFYMSVTFKYFYFQTILYKSLRCRIDKSKMILTEVVGGTHICTCPVLTISHGGPGALVETFGYKIYYRTKYWIISLR